MSDKANQWDRVIQAMLDVADVADEIGCYEQADAISGLLSQAKLVRTAQYEGPQNYFILNQRAFERAWRIKREKKGLSQKAPIMPEDFNSAQECWLDVLSEYQDALLGEDAEMLSKYAAKETRKLQTRAIATQGGKTYEHDVEIVNEDGKEILRISGMPGHWYVDDLREDPYSGRKGLPNALAIDFGQNWIWTNVKEVFDEIDSESSPEPETETASEGGSGAIMSGNMTEFHEKMEQEAKSRGMSYGEYIAKKFGPKGVEAGRAILSKVSEKIADGSPPGVAFYEAMDHFLSGEMARKVIASALASAQKVAYVIEEGKDVDEKAKVEELERKILSLGRALSVLEEELEKLRVFHKPSLLAVDLPKEKSKALPIHLPFEPDAPFARGE